MQKFPALIAFVLVAQSFVLPSALADTIKVRGTNVLIDRPAGFKDQANFSGFAIPEDETSVMVTELPAPFAAATAGFNEAGLATRGMKLLSKENRTVGNLPGVLLKVGQTAFGTNYHKWMLAFGDQNKTVIVTGSYPVSQAAHGESVKASVLSARPDTSTPASGALLIDDLPFAVPSTKELKLAQRVQNMLIFTPTGKLSAKGAADSSVFIIGQALSDLDIGDKETFARRRLRQTTDISNVQILAESDVKIARMPGREILATGVGKKGEKLFLYQVMLYGMGSYFIMQGMADENARAAREPQFRALATSFRLR